MASQESLFISCVSGEFAQPQGDYKNTRQKLAHFMRKTECVVKVQENFPQHEATTLEMLDEYIRGCRAVVHIVGEMPGSRAATQTVHRLLKKLEAEGRPFLSDQPPALLESLGDFSDLTYTQWEAFLSLHYGVSLFVYCSPEGRTAQKEHCQRLYLADPSRYGKDFANRGELIGGLVVDMRSIFPDLPEQKPNNLPGSIGNLFKGRTQFMGKIRGALESSAGAAPQTIAGLGGIGKTRLAIEFGHENADNYDALFFLTADSPEALKRNIADLTGPLVLDLPEFEADAETRLAAALKWLETHKNWFLIIDNVDHEEAAREVENMVAGLKNGHVLVTSRLSKWSNQMKKLDLELLDEAAAKEFLLEKTGNSRPATESDDTDLETLVIELDGLALGLEQAGAYISEREISFGEYRRRFAEQKAKVFEWHDERIMQYPASVAVTWQTSFDQLDDTARELLGQLSFMAPDAIPRAIVEDEDALIALRKLSLVRFVEAPPNSFVVHRLVQEIVRGRLDETEAKVSFDALISDLSKWAPVGGQDISTWNQWSGFAPHSETVFRFSASFGDTEESIYLLNGVAGFQEFRNGVYDEAEPLYRRALEFHERILGAEHPKTLSSVNNLAGVLESKGLYDEAEPLFRRALEAQERVLGPDHLSTINTLNNLAGMLKSVGSYDEAEELILRALEARDRVLGPEHPDTLNSVENFAGVLKIRGEYDEAELLYRRVLEIHERVFGTEHPNTFICVNNLAGVLESKGAYDEAEPLYRQTLETSERLLGSEHPHTLSCVNNLAALFKVKGSYDEAEPLYRRSLETRERILGEEHPDSLASVNNLAELLKIKGAYDEAEPLIRRTLEVQERVLGAEHPYTLISLNNLAALLDLKGVYDEAEQLYLRALEVSERILGAEHPSTLNCLNNLAFLLNSKGLYEEAELLYRRVLKAHELILGEEHPKTLNSVNNLADLLRVKGAFGEAEPLFRRALEAQGRVLGSDHPSTLGSVNNLAALHFAKREYDKAVPLFHRAYTTFAALLGEEHPTAVGMKQNLEICKAAAKGA